VLLDRLDVTEHFDVLAISGELGWEKPDPRIFKWAMEEAGVDAPSSVHVGDSPHFDPAPAAAIGMHGVLLDRHGRWEDDEAEYPRITTLGELVDLVDSMQEGG
jgi:FMN phosphatase YigB (HAD superfamily)